MAVDPQTLHRMLRVNQAGEYGAKRIYAGQLAVLGDNSTIRHMADQEQRHLDTFNGLIAKHQVRPTLLQPLWHLAGFALGAVTARLGEKTAMACTIAVEETIDQHYQEQLAVLKGAGEEELAATIEQFRQEELEHKKTAEDLGGDTTPFYPLLHTIIQTGSRVAIRLSERF